MIAISNICLVCNKELTMEELCQEDKLIVEICHNEVNGGDVLGMYHLRCRKPGRGSLTLKEYLYLEIVDGEKIAEEVDYEKLNPVTVFLGKFRFKLAESYSKYVGENNPKDLKLLMELAVKWMDECDLERFEVEDCVNWFMKDLKDCANKALCLGNFGVNKKYSLKNYSMDDYLQNLQTEIKKKKKQ